MLTPLDKYLSGVNDIIQIVVTTSCDIFTCSNCTQLLPFRRDYVHMSLECFEEAVVCLKTWPGIVALFGGNPCSHPQFGDLCYILTRYIPQNRRGLWSNNLLGHGAVCHSTFYPEGRFNLNAHASPKAAAYMDEWLPGCVIPSSRDAAAWHSPILISHTDFGLSESEWVAARESCDINQKWSAAIVERSGRPYAYFCEVAAALDGIRGENHGMPAVPGWWRDPMYLYQKQVEQCCDRGCGVPLKQLGHLDTSETYDVSTQFIPLTAVSKAKSVSIAHQLQLDRPVVEATDYMRLRT